MSNQTTGRHPEPSRFALFLRKMPNEPPFPGGSLTYNLRGDKWDKRPEKQLQCLLKYVLKNYPSFKFVFLYDNSKSSGNPDRIVLQVKNQTIEKNLLSNYKTLLAGFSSPELLQ